MNSFKNYDLFSILLFNAYAILGYTGQGHKNI